MMPLCLLAALTTAAAAANASRRLHEHCALYDDCSKKGGRCCNGDLRCFRKNEHWAACRWKCEAGSTFHHDPADHRTPWSCEEVPVSGPTPAPPPPPSEKKVEEEKEGEWIKGMLGTHFWDCEAGDCDSSILRPFVKRKAVLAPANAPADPEEHGGSVYGEKLWMTGAMSDALSRWMGPNLLGYDDKYSGKCGGCGQCVLVRNPESDHPDWSAVVMKKVRCHPANPKCSGEQMTIDFAVPSFDHLKYSLANRCGSKDSEYTFLTKEQSGTCGAAHRPSHCNCSKIPDTTPEQRMMRKGCELFKTWDWHHGTPTKLEYKKVDCPQRMIDRFNGPGGFGGDGVIEFVEATVVTDALSVVNGRIYRDMATAVGAAGLVILSAGLLRLRRSRLAGASRIAASELEGLGTE